MNTVGKIFVMLIFVMSVMFMSFVIAVYMTHTNWKDKSSELAADLSRKVDEIGKLQDQLDQLKVEYDSEMQSLGDRLGQAEDERDRKSDDLATLQDQIVTLQDQSSRALTEMRATQENMKKLADELDTLEAEWRQAIIDRNMHFEKFVELNDALHSKTLELQSLQERSALLARELADSKQVLTYLDAVPDPAAYTNDLRVYGKVLAVRDSGLIEISIGSDDGLLKQHELQIYREADGQSTYLGKVEVTHTEPDKAVCKILPEYLKRTIQEGDNVASRLD